MSTPPLVATVRFELNITVTCPKCGHVHYTGPAINDRFEEPISIGQKFTCSQCHAEAIIRDERLTL